jgi:hypothetical protein
MALHVDQKVTQFFASFWIIRPIQPVITSSISDLVELCVRADDFTAS